MLLAEVLRSLAPQPGEIAVDGTLGFGGHAAALLAAVGPTGKLLGLDLDSAHLPGVQARLASVGHPFHIQQGNFASLPVLLGAQDVPAADMMLADLGVSSMQLDDVQRGFSYRRDGPLDMRMDATRGRSAAEVLATIAEPELAEALRTYGDEEDAARIAAAIVRARHEQPLERTQQLAQLIVRTLQGGATWRLHPAPGQWKTHPAARTFQALRILVNRELANLHALLRVLPACLRPGGRVALISFHSGEDRLVKTALRDGLRVGTYRAIAEEPVRASFDERRDNPRARSAKLRWGVKA